MKRLNMNKIITIIFTVFFIFLFSLAEVSARDLELVTKKVDKNSPEEITVQYGVINKKNFDLFNVSLCFKVLKEEVPVACKEIKTTVPKGSDGSDIKEITIKIPADEKDLRLVSTIFYSTRRYKIEKWFSGCKNFK